MNQNQLERFSLNINAIREACNQLAFVINEVNQESALHQHSPTSEIISLIKDKEITTSFVSLIGEIIREIKTQENNNPSKNGIDEPTLNKNHRLMNTHLTQLVLSSRTKSCLESNNIKTVGELIQYSRDELMCIKGLGFWSMKSIEIALQKLGLYLKY